MPLVLGAVFLVIALTADLVYAAGSGTLGGWLATRPRLFRQQERAAGLIYLCLAGLAAMQGTRHSATT